MSIREIDSGDIMECPHCGRDFEMNNINDEDIDDFDDYFMHITTCDGR
jgi:hypothetical protein